MCGKKRLAKKQLSNFKGTITSEKWKKECEEKKGCLFRLVYLFVKRLSQAYNLLKTKFDELQEQIDTEKQAHVDLERKLVLSESRCRQLETSFGESEKMRCALAADSEKSLNDYHDVQTQLELSNSELDERKKLALVDAIRQTKAQTKAGIQHREETRNLTANNKRIKKELEKTEDASAKMFPYPGKYDDARCYNTRQSVTNRCIDFLRAAGTNTTDYNALLKNVVRRSYPGNESPLLMSPKETLIFKAKLHLSEDSLKMSRSLIHEFLGFRVLASKDSVNNLKHSLSTVDNYKIDVVVKEKVTVGKATTKHYSTRISIIDLMKELVKRTELLDHHNQLIENEENEVTLCLQADKGSLETKICVAIENVQNPSIPHNLLLVAMYEGSDSEDELRENALSVFQMWNDITEINYTSKNGKQKTKKVVLKFIGDLKIISAVLGHRGQSCSNPCYLCELVSTNSGPRAQYLKDVDFRVQAVQRSLATYERDALTGSNGVRKDSESLCKVEPCDFAICTVHASMGLCERYFENHINGEINIMDNIDVATGTTLRKQRKEQTELVKKEKVQKTRLDRILAAREEAFCTFNALKLISLNKSNHLKDGRLCSSMICTFYHLPVESRTDAVVKCAQCSGFFHFSCCSIFHPDEKIRAARMKKWKCKTCIKFDMQMHLSAAMTATNTLTDEADKESSELTETTQQRSALDAILLTSIGKTRKQYEILLSSFGCDTRTWYKAFTGNQVRKILREVRIDAIFALLRYTPENARVMKAMKSMAKLMSCSNNKIYSDQEIDSIEALLNDFLEEMKHAFPEEIVTPKLHLLACHLIPYMREHHTWGRSSEQAIEHFHAVINNLKTRYAPVRNLVDRASLMIEDLAIRNWMHDTGAQTEL